MNLKIFILLSIGSLILADQIRDDGYTYYKEALKAYKYMPTPITWNSARLLCEAQNATMAMPKTPQQLQVLTNIFKSKPPAKGSSFPHLFLAAFHDFFDEGSFINLYDHLPIASFLKWHAGEPNELKIHAQEDCGSLSGIGELYDFPCHRLGVFFCEKTPIDNLDDYTYYPEAIMNYKFSPTAMKWDEARRFCESENAQLAMPTNQIQLDTLTQAFKLYPPSPSAAFKELFMAGFHDFFSEGSFINLYDKQPIPSFLKWQPGEPNELAINQNEDCGCIGKNGNIYDYPCERLGVFFCQKEHNFNIDIRFWDS